MRISGLNFSHNTPAACSLAAVGLLAIASLAGGCASIGNPSGGPRDEDPPRFVKANPPMGQTNVSLTLPKASLEFNELVNVKDAFSKVMISPNGATLPRVSSQGRRVNIEFQDSLMANTTYTIDFADAIEDNNEGNKLQGFFYTFSTGAEIDSLEVSGMVLGARDLEPQQQMLVGIYSESGDSIFARKPFERIARTDDKGRFTIGGLKVGTYRIYALKDLDNDRMYANPEEDVAFLPFTISPTAERVEVSDTILNLKSGAVDTIVSRTRTRFLPNDLLLRSFNTGVKPQYLVEYARKDSTQLTMRFNTAADSLPRLSLKGVDDFASRVIAEHSATNDTITFWLPRDIASRDSLEIAASFARPDSAGVLVNGTDLLEFNRVAVKTSIPKGEKTKKKKTEPTLQSPPATVRSLDIKSLTTGTQEVYNPLYIEFETPLEQLDTASFRVEVKVDTLWQPAPHQRVISRADSLNPRRLRLDYPWQFKTSYRVVADSAAAVGIYGQISKEFSTEFSTKSEDDYSSIIFTISGLYPGEKAFVELLNGSDNPVRKVSVTDSKAVFEYLDPGVYYARLTLDANGNGVFDPGDPLSGLMPDEAYYYPGRVNLKKGWDMDQSWDLFATAVDLQKPTALVRNKPATAKGSRNKEEVENDEEPFDPTANPFDPVESRKRKEAAKRRNGGYQ